MLKPHVPTSQKTGRLMFEDIATNALRRRRKKLLTQLPPSDSLLRGSLIERYKRCGNANCHCQKGRGHGP